MTNSMELRFQSIAYQIAVSYVEEILAGCEFVVYEKGRSVRNSMYCALNYSPNVNMSGVELKKGFLHHYYYDNQAAIIPMLDRFYLADDFTLDPVPLGEDLLRGISIGTENAFQLKYDVRVGNAYVIRQRNQPILDLVTGMFASYNALLSYALSGYKATNGAKYILEYDSYGAGDDSFKTLWDTRIQSQMKAFADAQNGVFPQMKGMKLTSLSSSTASKKSADDIISLRKDAFAVTAEAFRLPVSMLEGNMTNINDIFGQAMTACILPVARMISCELTRKTYRPEEIAKGSRIVVDTTNCKYIDILSVADKADKLISSSVANTDEIRDLLGMEPTGEAWAQVHRITKNYDLASNLDAAGGESNE